jgi:hypothetical protein
LPRTALGVNPDLGCHVLHVQNASLFSVDADGFRFVTNCLDLIDAVGGGERTSGSIVANERDCHTG